jgi:hypothetical protein
MHRVGDVDNRAAAKHPGSCSCWTISSWRGALPLAATARDPQAPAVSFGSEGPRRAVTGDSPSCQENQRVERQESIRGAA